MKRSQADLDALADAETLWSITNAWDGGDTYEAEKIGKARSYGELAGWVMTRNFWLGPNQQKRYHPAELAASWAFRAVPALRGEGE